VSVDLSGETVIGASKGTTELGNISMLQE